MLSCGLRRGELIHGIFGQWRRGYWSSNTARETLVGFEGNVIMQECMQGQYEAVALLAAHDKIKTRPTR